MLTITHTPTEGTIIDGTSKGDGTAPILKTAGWKWGRSITAWYIPHSRDRAPHLARIEHTAAALRAAGYDVETDIDTTLRDGTDAHHDRNERLTDRAAALTAKAERKATAADAAHARHDHACAALPEGGEPIKVGHHSERRHRRALDRAHTTARAAVEADAAARSAAESARIAARSTDHRYTPAVIHRRIERQSAELRRIERHLIKYRAAGRTTETSSHMHQLELNKAELERDIEYWTAVRAEQDATDGPKLYRRADLRPGCFVNCSGTWHKVIRVNAKSVTVATAYSWTDRLPYDKIADARAEDAHTPIRPGQYPTIRRPRPRPRPPVPTRREDAMSAESLFAECIIPGCTQPVTDELTPCQTCRTISDPCCKKPTDPRATPPPTSQNETQAPPLPTA